MPLNKFNLPNDCFTDPDGFGIFPVGTILMDESGHPDHRGVTYRAMEPSVEINGEPNQKFRVEGPEGLRFSSRDLPASSITTPRFRVVWYPEEEQ